MRHPAPHRTLTILASSALLVLGATATAAAETPNPMPGEACSMDAIDSRVSEVGPCTVETHTARVRHAQLGESFEVTAQDLTCGEVEIHTWAEVQSDALEACRWVAPMPDRLSYYDISETVDVVGSRNGLVSLEHVHAGYTGGAHPYAAIEVGTWDTVTGRRVALREVLPEHAAGLETRLRARYDASDQAELYRFDPDAFVILEDDQDAPILRFRFTHDVEVVRGTTLDFDLRVPEGVEPRRPEMMTPVSY